MGTLFYQKSPQLTDINIKNYIIGYYSDFYSTLTDTNRPNGIHGMHNMNIKLLVYELDNMF